MDAVTMANARRILQDWTDEQLEELLELPHPKSYIVRQVLQERKEVAALREKYPYDVLDEMSDEELEEIVWFQLLNRYPIFVAKPLLADIFYIQDRRQGKDFTPEDYTFQV